MSQIASDAKISSVMSNLGMTAPLPNLDDSQVLKAILVALGNVTSGGGGGTGDVVGPASSTDSAVALWDGVTGKLLKNSSAFITGGGTVALGGFTLTVPATGTAALLGTANVFTAGQSIAAGSLLTTALSVSQTWNSAGTTCRGFEYTITDTNSAAASTAFRLLGGAAGSTVLASIDKSGKILATANGNSAAPDYAFVGTTNAGITIVGGQLSLCQNGSEQMRMGFSVVNMFAALTFLDGYGINFGTSTGTKIGGATTQKIGFWNTTPVVQPAHIADPSGGAVVDTEARTAINAILAWQATLGLTAAA